MNNSDDVNLLLQQAVNDPIRIFKKLAQRLIVILWNHRSQAGLVHQPPTSLEDSFHQAPGILRRMPADECLDGVQIG
jgi:hypothetical protein